MSVKFYTGFVILQTMFNSTHSQIESFSFSFTFIRNKNGLATKLHKVHIAGKIINLCKITVLFVHFIFSETLKN